ncbi:MAG: integrase [Thiotrichales bacterium]|nr:integrase [Thiotrichales bacterium]MCY4286957.1 integrase [Thiotrichales bacterium]MCY4349817.1 integrase [Thiotrichales bacterium]
MYSLDTLRTARDLEAAGLDRQQAEAIASAIGRADEQAATKADLAALRSEVRWMFGFQAALIVAMAARLFGLV